MYDRAAFFRAIREALFHGALAQSQVDGVTALLDEADGRSDLDPRHFAYMLATTFHETARTMQPVPEYGRGHGKSYGVPDLATGQTYYGRGLVQLTHKENYAKAGILVGLDLVREADLAMGMPAAVKILFVGMLTGMFTGRRLADFIVGSRCDYVGARAIINGTDRAATIAGYAKAFEAALRASRRVAPAPPPKPAAPAAAAPASSLAATKAPTMFSLSNLAGLLTMAQAGFSVAHEYSSVAPQLASGASKVAKDGGAVAAGIGELISDVKGGRYSETPEDVTAILGKFGELVGDVEGMVAPAAKILGKASALPSVAGIKTLAAAA